MTIDDNAILRAALTDIVGPGAQHEETCDKAEHDDDGPCIWCAARAALVKSSKARGIAELFIAKLVENEGFTDATFAEVAARNRSVRYKKFKTCATHDFCDANMPMDEAFLSIVGHRMGDLESDDAADDADRALWSEAWDIAQALIQEKQEAKDGAPKGNLGDGTGPSSP